MEERSGQWSPGGRQPRHDAALATEGQETRNRRPAVIVGNDASNRHLDRVQAIPLTSKVDRVYPSEAVVHLGAQRSKALADQLTTAAKSSLSRFAGALAPEDMAAVERALALQLGRALPGSTE